MFDDTLIPSLTFNTFYISVDLLCKCCNYMISCLVYFRCYLCVSMSPDINCTMN